MTASPLPTPDAWYVETSAVLRVLAEGDQQLARELRHAKRLVTSILTLVECERGLRRAVTDRRLDAQQHRAGQRWLARFSRANVLVALSETVIEYAKRAFPAEPVRTLDAIHLATIKVWDESFGMAGVLSTDARVRDNAAAWGLAVLPES